MKIEKLKPGMRVYSMGRTKMGNTTLTTVSVWPVYIKDVDLENRRVLASWNGNEEKYWYEGTFSKWKAEQPMLIVSAFGRARLATREEIKDAKAKKALEDQAKQPATTP